MITIIAGTNRRNSEALQFSRHFAGLFRSRTEEPVHILALEDIPATIWQANMYDKGGLSPDIRELQDEVMIPADKFFFVIPEYNGSFPGALKLFLDAISVREYRKTFRGKKAALVGIATGRAGNLRGMDHLTGVLHHVGTHVMPNKLPISSIEKLMDADGNITDAATLLVMEKHVDEFLLY